MCVCVCLFVCLSVCLRGDKFENCIFGSLPCCRSRTGGDEGSDYIQLFSGLLREHFRSWSIEDVCRVVKRNMVDKTKVGAAETHVLTSCGFVI